MTLYHRTCDAIHLGINWNIFLIGTWVKFVHYLTGFSTYFELILFLYSSYDLLTYGMLQGVAVLCWERTMFNEENLIDVE